MTIDEAIAYAREKAKYKKTKYDKCPTRMRYCCEMCFHKPKCNEVAKEHEQLAEWLEELKSYRASVFSGYMTQKMLKEEYSKAIDDLLGEMNQITYNCQDADELFEKICDLAEQLKVGGVNGKERS